MHHINPTKCVVRTWNNHFTAGIAGLPPSSPLAHWCQLMTQSNATLNMTSLSCCLNPLLFSHKALEKTFLVDTTLMAPLGMEVLSHQKPGQHKTWGYLTTKTWYLSHAAAQYHCICVIMKETGGSYISFSKSIQV